MSKETSNRHGQDSAERARFADLGTFRRMTPGAGDRPSANPSRSELPSRYAVKEVEGDRFLTCSEAPTVLVTVEKGLSVPLPAAKQYPAGSIFLDGAAHGEPFLDAKKHVYNLDHHDGVVRSFTLATCEQALVLVRRGLDLQAREWKVFANEPDLDTILAIWVLLNHMRLNAQGGETRDRVIPLIRVEGCIDVHGLEMQELCGLPPDLWQERFEQLQSLQRRAARLREAAEDGVPDLLEFTVSMLHGVDELVYTPDDFEELEEVEELARCELVNNSFVVAGSYHGAVYEAERILRRLYGQRLGVLILQKEPGAYTLRQVDSFLPANLEAVYSQLNLMDPAAGNRRSGNRWGGSSEIGGSPRKTGTRLSPQQICLACRRAYQQPSGWERWARVGRTILTTAAVIMVSWLVAYLPGLFQTLAQSGEAPPPTVTAAGSFTAVLALLNLLLLSLGLRQGPGLFGWRRPASLEWLIPAPLALLAAAAGGAWAPDFWLLRELTGRGFWVSAADTLLLVAAIEVLFRGLVYGQLVRAFGIPRLGRRWRLTPPVLVSAILYTLWTAVPLWALAGAPGQLTPVWGWTARLLAALLFGLTAGLARERSESLLAPILLHWAGVAILLLLH